MLSQLPKIKARIYSRSSRYLRPNAAPALTETGYNYRQGKPRDVEFIRKRLLLESMNPLGIKPENFTIVEESSGNIVAFAQLQQLSAANTREFRSLIVLPEHRGKEIGSQLLKHMVASCPDNIYLTTLRKTIPFYSRAGFRLVQASDVPWYLWLEAAAGTVVARVAAKDDLVVMLRLAGTAAPTAL